MKQLIDACKDDEFLTAHDVTPWSELPGWLPASSDIAGFGRRSNRRAMAAGLKLAMLRTWRRPGDRLSANRATHFGHLFVCGSCAVDAHD